MTEAKTQPQKGCRYVSPVTILRIGGSAATYTETFVVCG